MVRAIGHTRARCRRRKRGRRQGELEQAPLWRLDRFRSDSTVGAAVQAICILSMARRRRGGGGEGGGGSPGWTLYLVKMTL